MAAAIASAVASIGFLKIQPERPLSNSARERKHTINLAEHEKSSKAMRMSLSLQQQQLAMDEAGQAKSSLTDVGGKNEFVVLEVGTVAPPNTPNNEEEQDEIDWLDEDADDCGTR